MQLHAPFVKLPFRFDADRLSVEVEALPADAWRRHPTGHQGNTAVSLVSRRGDHTDDSLGGQQAPTTWLAPDSYLAQTIASFGVPVGRTRLMRIDAGAEATPHFDAHLYWFDRVRLHVPIITTPAVEFLCGDARVHMAAGESWVFDTFRQHNVLNESEASRVHLVIDTVGTPALWEMIREGGPAITVEYEPGRTPVLLPEHANIPRVMQPWHLDSTARRLHDLFPDTEAARAMERATLAFIEAWRSLWALHGPDPAAPGYRVEADRFAAELAGLDDFALEYNGASGRAVTHSLCIASALGPLPPGTPMKQSRQRKKAAASSRPSGPARSRPDGNDPSPKDRDERFDRPVIIVSPPRAGSTLLFETMAMSPDAFTIGKESHGLIESVVPLRPDHHDWHSNELTAADATEPVVTALRNLFFDDLRDRRGTPPPMNARFLRLVEKTPKNALRIEFLDRVFPDARYVYLSRPPREEISSMIDAWRSGGFVTYPDLPGWEGPDGLPWSLLLIPGWRDLIGKSLAEVCATQWEYTTNKILDDLDRVAPGRWTVANYDQLVGDPQAEMKRLAKFASLRWDGNLKGPLPLSRHTLTPPSPDKWKRNATELSEVLPAVSETAERARRVSNIGGQVSPRPAQVAAGAGAEATMNDRLSSKHTDSVPELLTKANATVLMSTYQAGQVAALRSMDGALNTHFTRLPRPMGMAVGPKGHLAIGSNDEIWTYRDQPAAAKKIKPEGAYSSCYVLRQRHHTGDIAIHEMVYDGDGELWVVNTRFSCLVTVDPDHSFVPRWMPPFVTDLQPEDRCHLNGLATRDKKPRYVSLFSESNDANGWRDTKAFGGAIMDIDSNEFVTRGLCMPHTPRWYRDQLWVLESGKGSLSRVDIESGDVEIVATLPGFTRGMAFIGRYALIGLSQVRESVFDGLPLTQTDEARHSGLWVVDLESGKTVGFVRFDGSVQEVFDVQVVFGAGHLHLADLQSEEHNLSFVVPSESLSRTN